MKTLKKIAKSFVAHALHQYYGYVDKWHGETIDDYTLSKDLILTIHLGINFTVPDTYEEQGYFASEELENLVIEISEKLQEMFEMSETVESYMDSVSPDYGSQTVRDDRDSFPEDFPLKFIVKDEAVRKFLKSIFDMYGANKSITVNRNERGGVDTVAVVMNYDEENDDIRGSMCEGFSDAGFLMEWYDDILPDKSNNTITFTAELLRI